MAPAIDAPQVPSGTLSPGVPGRACHPVGACRPRTGPVVPLRPRDSAAAWTRPDGRPGGVSPVRWRHVTVTDSCVVLSDASHLTSTGSCGTIPLASRGSGVLPGGPRANACAAANGRGARPARRSPWTVGGDVRANRPEPGGGLDRDRDRGSKPGPGPGSGKGPNGTWGCVPVVTTRTGCQTTSVWRRDSTRDRCTGRHADGSP